MTAATESLADLIQAAPFIDIALDDSDSKPEQSKQATPTTPPEKQFALLPLPLGTENDDIADSLYPHLLRAHIALAKLSEASDELVVTQSPTNFLLLDEVLSNQRYQNSAEQTQLSVPELLVNDDGGEVYDLVDLSVRLAERVANDGISQQILIELASALDVSRNRKSDKSKEASAAKTDTTKSNAFKPSMRSNEIDHNQDNIFTGTAYDVPQGNELKNLFENWQEYVELSNRNVDSLIFCALAYHRFLSLSPFVAYNQFAARLIWQLLLIDAGLYKLPLLALSAQLAKANMSHRALFLDALNPDDKQAKTLWLQHCIDIVEQAATHSLSSIHQCRHHLRDLQQNVESAVAKKHGIALYELLSQKPVVRIKDVVDAGIAKRQTASIYLNKLVSQGLLVERQSGKGKLFYNQGYLVALGFMEEGA